MAKIISTGRTISTTEYLQKKHNERRKRLLVACGAFVLLASAVIFVLRLQALQVSQVAVSGAAATEPGRIETAARQYLAGKYLWLVPRTNIFFYPRAGLERELMRRFPRLASAAVSLEGARGLAVSVSERKPFALYCSGTCYFMDERGFVFDISPQFSDGVYFSYSSEPALEDPLGKEFLPSSEFQALAALAAELQKLGADPRSMLLRADDEEIKLGGGGTLLVRRDADALAVVAALESFLQSDEIKREADFWMKLATLDMRTENKVFYSFKD